MTTKVLACLIFLSFLNYSSLVAQISVDIFKKKWKLSVDMRQRMQAMNSEQREAFAQLPPEVQKKLELEMKDQAEKSLFEFYSDNTFKVSIEGHDTYEGTWRIGDDGKTIIARTREGIEEKVIIKKLESDRLVFASETRDPNNDVVLIPK
ncbi:MAG: hypothetical protein MUE85_15335 [Microscillaceae bacterium]|jgi:hypothetical protein|nr:hypothetical protein [Microscillaceae bacterium]